MKLIIDIPEEVKETFDKADDINFCFYDYNSVIGKAIRNGIPLPKGHGRLIDVDKLEYTCTSDECGMLLGCNHCQYYVVTEDEIDNAPTIIEADKAESEE